MATKLPQTPYDADLWDLQSALSTVSTSQERPVSSDLEDLYFDCGDVPMQDHEPLTPGRSMKPPETGSDESRAVPNDEEARTLLQNYGMSTAGPLKEVGQKEAREAEAMNSDGKLGQPVHDPDFRMADVFSDLESANSEQVEAVQRAEATHHPSEESEPEFEEGMSTQKVHASKRKQEYKQKFDRWARQHAKIITDEEIRLRKPAPADESLSIRELMRKDQRNIITDPREYQLELFERAKKQNIIAVLDTGSGKTLIAVLLLRHMIDQELEDRLMGKKPRTAFFLVDSVALVFQQYEVLSANLDQPIECFCGDMNADLWAKATWQSHLKQNMIIVCTAEILNQCLMHSFISIDQINILIFDEAHHAKKNHAYAQIIKDYYIAEMDESKRPKVFGMTASPVDVRHNFTQAARELETMLHCQIATTADLALLRTSVSRPNEAIVEYAGLQIPYETALGRELRTRYGSLKSLAKVFTYAREATSELGEWCADQVWSFAMAEKEAVRFERRIEKAFTKKHETTSVEMLDDEIGRLHEAQKFVSDWKFVEPMERPNGISSKVLVLRQYLDLIFERPTDARCIIFVDRRYTARLLKELFARFGSPHLRSGLLVGARNGDPGDAQLSVRQQILTLNQFRKGVLNCLVMLLEPGVSQQFATSIAEEGLDIPECNLVIRFDLYRTLIQYIQSRGRARHVQSKEVMKLFCESLPADRLLQGNEANLDASLDKEKNFRVFIDPESGAKLTYASSLVVLAHFVSCLPDASSSPNYIVTAEHGQFTCDVVLPESSPVHSARGRPSARKSIARRSAAFEACLLLRKGGHIDENLLSTHHKHLPAMRNAHLALHLNKSSNYEMKIKPRIWQESRGALPQSLYVTVFRLEKPECLGRDSQPVALLTRTRLPDFPSVMLHLQPDMTSNLHFNACKTSFPVSADSLAKLTTFTLRIYKDVFNKKFEVNEPAMSYWFAPIMKHRNSVQHDPGQLLDWETINYVHANEEWRWSIGRSPEELENRYLVDKWDGGRRFWAIKVLPDLHPDDPVPSDAAAHRYMASILDYSVSLYPNSRKNVVWRKDQPVIYAHRILHRLNWLDEFTAKELNTSTIAYVCPEPLLFSALPTSVAAMAYLIPSAISRVESYLIALEACDMLGLKIRPDLALEAITKDSDNTEEHRQEQIHLQRGMGKNYERLEFLGDCFLKMATSISIFCLHPNDSEFDYHVKRMLLICNQNLLNVATEKKLYEYIRSIGFSRRNWYPRGIKLLEGKGANRTEDQVHKHELGEKTIADVAEALIGAALLSYKTGNMDMAVKAVTALVSSSDHNVTRWADYYKLYTKPAYQLKPALGFQINLVIQVERDTGYRFAYPRLLASAFVHSSLSHSHGVPSYQRLEFLGDSLLDMVCVNFLFHRHPDRDPQWLTEHKGAMVSNKFLAALAVRLGFHKHLRYNTGPVEGQNRAYVEEITELEAEHDGDPRDYWTSASSPPKALADIVESFIGAMFVDSGFEFARVERFFDAHVRWFFEDMSVYDTFANRHPVTLLHTHLSVALGCANYKVMAADVPNATGMRVAHQVAVVMVHGEVVASGTAAGSKNAKIKAATRALQELKPLAPFEFRERWGCDCTDGKGQGLEDVGTAI
ncbi:MAG: hypothetical protein LQ345_001232 [Seirophora villosa]|nr:MAG: hypothetical protein LQ345_001232 [Seirophora villosa]